MRDMHWGGDDLTRTLIMAGKNYSLNSTLIPLPFLDVSKDCFNSAVSKQVAAQEACELMNFEQGQTSGCRDNPASPTFNILRNHESIDNAPDAADNVLSSFYIHVKGCSAGKLLS